jgi:protein SCO1/2
MLRTVSAGIAALALGSALLWDATGGLRVFTAEGARRAAVERAPRRVPNVTLVDMHGREIRFPRAGEPRLVEFIYTRCPTICAALGETFARLGPRIADEAPGTRLVSVSFDLAHDDAEAMRGYAEMHGADGKLWTVARPASQADLDKLLDAFAVTVIPDGYGGFEHNAAVHYVDAAGRLAGIYGLEDDDAILNKTGAMR